MSDPASAASASATQTAVTLSDAPASSGEIAVARDADRVSHAQGAVASDRVESGTAVATAEWPKDWRDRMAGGDVSLRRILDRFVNPAAVAQSWLNAERKIRSAAAAMPSELPVAATPEQMAEYHRARGVPDRIEDYDIALADGLVIGAHEMPLLTRWLAKMHAQHRTQIEVNGALNAYYEMREELATEQADKDREYKRGSEETLRTMYGGDFRRYMTAVDNLLTREFSRELRALIGAARLADGRLMFNHPDVVRWFVDRALEDGYPTVAGAEGASQASSIVDEITRYKSMMADRNSEYHRGPKAARHKARYRELLDAQQRLGGRGRVP